MTTPEETLANLGHPLPKPTTPVAAYVPAVRTGNLVYTAGQLPFVDGKMAKTGKLGAGVTLEEGQAYARTAALNALAVVKAEIGELSKVRRIVRVAVFVASADSFTDQPKVANGASELIVQVFGDKGKHARAAVGVNVLPLDAPVEIEMLVEVG